jgi:hypothetical protein
VQGSYLGQSDTDEDLPDLSSGSHSLEYNSGSDPEQDLGILNPKFLALMKSWEEGAK